MSDALDEGPDFERDLVALFGATLLRAPALDVIAAQSVVSVEDVELLDAPTAVIFRTAVGVARRKTDPTQLEVHGQLLRDGRYSGHHGELVKARMLEATSNRNAHGQRLHEVAGQLLSVIFRFRLAASGAALAAAARDSSELDCWLLVKREGAAARRLWERLERLHPQEAMVSR